MQGRKYRVELSQPHVIVKGIFVELSSISFVKALLVVEVATLYSYVGEDSMEGLVI